MENKTVDVIIPAYHPGKEFATLIKRLEKQSVPIHRIIVMNTEESMWNKEWEKLSDVMEIHHLAKSEFDHGGTRAQAAELSDDIYDTGCHAGGPGAACRTSEST